MHIGSIPFFRTTNNSIGFCAWDHFFAGNGQVRRRLYPDPERPADAELQYGNIYITVQHHGPSGQRKVSSQQQRHGPAEHGLLSLRPGVRRCQRCR